MKVGLQTWGTEGDFMPFLALAVGLKNAGHEVTLAYTSIDGKDYSSYAETEGINLVRANGNVTVPKDFNPYALGAKPGSFREYSKLLERYFEPYTEAMYAASVQLSQHCDVVVGHAVCHTLLTAAEKFDKPRVSLVLTPLVIKSNYVSPIGIDLGPLLNSFLWNVGGFVATKSWFAAAKQVRQKEGLPKVKSLQKELFTSQTLTIVAASEFLCERPLDWCNHIHQTGFLNLERVETSWEMPEDLQQFLSNGKPPIYMTFGSCMQFDLKQSTQLLIDAAEQSGFRAIIQSDWEVVGKPNSSDIYCISSAPHSEIFKHCDLIVHHGGAGTTQSALIAGKPAVIVPHGFDQVYWADVVEKTGIGTKTDQKNKVSAGQLSEAIKQVTSDQTFTQIAQIIGDKMKTENGVSKAIMTISQIQ